MVESVSVLATLQAVASTLLLVAVAAYLTFSRPRNAPRILAALFLALIGFRGLATIGVVGGPPGPPGSISATERAWVDVSLLGSLAFLAFFAVYPTRVRLRSLHGAVLAAGAALLVAVLVLWVADKGLFFDPGPGEVEPGSRPTWVDTYLRVGGQEVMFVLAVLSGLWRARPLPPSEQRAAFVLIPLLAVSPFTRVGRFVVAALERALAGVDPLNGLLGRPPDLAYFALTVLVPLAVAVALSWRWRAHAALLLVGLWAAVSILVVPGPGGEEVGPNTHIVRALAPMYVISRHGALGGIADGMRAQRVLAAVAMLLVFLVVNTYVGAIFPDSPLVLSLGVLMGLAAGGVAALAVAPFEAVGLPRRARRRATPRAVPRGAARGAAARAGGSPAGGEAETAALGAGRLGPGARRDGVRAALGVVAGARPWRRLGARRRVPRPVPRAPAVR